LKAFVEHLSGIVRVGVSAEKYGDPFEFAIAFASTDGRTAIIKALTSSGDFTIAHARAVIKALKDVGLEADWERVR
jgi:hypothetical protein